MLFDFLDTGLILRFAINVVAMTVLVFGLFYLRYRDKELVTAASLFNIFAFGVLSILGSVEFSLAAGLASSRSSRFSRYGRNRFPRSRSLISSGRSRLR